MKIILISQRVEIIENIGERRDALSQEWAELAEKCGFILLPVPNDPKNTVKIFENISPEGIILSGGNDLCRYGGNAPERDETEKILINLAVKNNIPLLGVCRGMQMILDFFGAELVKVDGHIRTEHILNNGRKVNSFHAWAAKECPDTLIVTANSDDGSVEEIVHSEYKNIMGIMWHPERYSPIREEDIKRIRSFFDL